MSTIATSKYMQQEIIADSVRGCLMAGAAGDALGYEVEFESLARIRSLYGKEGISRFQLKENGKAIVSDDTQMTLFTACGLLNGLAVSADKAQMVKFIEKAYIDWFFTQNSRMPHHNPYTWLGCLPEMKELRAPGNTCLSACMSLLNDMEADNYSKGCGGIMRAAPVALLASAKEYSIEELATLGAESAKSTHKHPHGFLPAALLTALVRKVLPLTAAEVKENLDTILTKTLDILDAIYPGKYEKDKRLLRKLSENAIKLARADVADTDAIEILGEGWTGEETWAIALYCTVRHIDSVEKAIIASVNHDGDSDSTGAVSGNIMGAIHGYRSIKEARLFCPDGCTLEETLELSDIILTIAEDLITGNPIAEDHAVDTPEKEQWYRRYSAKEPAWIK